MFLQELFISILISLNNVGQFCDFPALKSRARARAQPFLRSKSASVSAANFDERAKALSTVLINLQSNNSNVNNY